jgi:hypothetical protein
VVTGYGNWDSHYDNHAWQTRMSGRFYPALGAFLDGLRARRNRHGRLADQTVVFIGSEVGRFPRLNHFAGKDHFPEVPYMLWGRPMATGTFGRTGPEMEALPVSLATGKAKRGGTQVSIDDVGASLLALAGLDPLAYGYVGRRCEFLFG